LRKRLLTSALDYYQEFLHQRQYDPGAQAELLDTTRRVEKILADLAVLRAAGHLYLLIQPPAIADLQLSDAQREKVFQLSARASKRWLESFGDRSRLSLAERRREALEQARTNETEIAAILTPAQHERLRQLALQAEGLGAFREPEVIAALRLSPEQRERIRSIEAEELFARVRVGGRAFQSADDDATRSAGTTLATDGVMKVLTREQAHHWRKLLGPPLKGSLSVFPLPFNPQRDSKRLSH
jgi:hypothetical protein